MQKTSFPQMTCTLIKYLITHEWKFICFQVSDSNRRKENVTASAAEQITHHELITHRSGNQTFE